MVPRVEGSSPFTHPIFFDPVAQSAEHLPFKQGVRGSNPRWITRKNAVKTLSFAAFFLFPHDYFVGKVNFAFFVHIKRIPVFTVFCGCRVCHLLCHLHKRKREGKRPPFSYPPYPGITVLGSMLCPFLCTLKCRCGAELLLAERIAQMQQALERLARKIAHYEKCAAFEHTLRDGETSRK